jgi:hypothetical protein
LEILRRQPSCGAKERGKQEEADEFGDGAADEHFQD